LARKQIVKILITGNMGYVGPSVAKFLRKACPDTILHDLDNAYVAHCLTGAPVFPERDLNEQFHGEVRAIPSEMMSGYDAVVQLAAISRSNWQTIRGWLASGEDHGRFTPAVAEVDWDALDRAGRAQRDYRCREGRCSVFS
jgi:hypothetical protein